MVGSHVRSSSALRHHPLLNTDHYASVNARILYRELRDAEGSNMLVKQVMAHLLQTGSWLDLATPTDARVGAVVLGDYKDGKWGCNSRGMGCLLLDQGGFGIRVGRLLTSSGDDTSLLAGYRQMGLAILDGIENALWPRASHGSTQIVAATSARLRYYNVTFSEVIDRIRSYAVDVTGDRE